ncbi:MAG: hypothetical protein ABI894_12535 [Ilumatobacteraceae bacterium]
MGIKRNRKWVGAAVMAVTGLAGGAVAVHATTFTASATAAAPSSFPAIAPTCTADPCDVNLYAGTGSVAVTDEVHGAANVPFYGFGVNSGLNVALAGDPISVIKAPVGTTINIHLTQDGALDPIDLSFPSLPVADVTDNGGGSYTVQATTVGTSVFQPGLNPGAPKQIAMGLVGVLIVTPVGCSDVNRMCAYDSTSYDDEALVATTDLDLEFAMNPNTFDMGYFGQSIDPDFSDRQVYHVINGKSFPDTDVIDVRSGDNVLLRYVNAGVTDKSMGLLGLRQSLLARNASEYTDPQLLISPLIGPGETADVAVKVSDTAPAGQFYSLIDSGRQMNNGTSTGFGGALTFLHVWAAVPSLAGLNAFNGQLQSLSVGNPLVDRAFATDFPTPIGTLSPVLVVLSGSPLPADGTLNSFETWNQASQGLSAIPPTGGVGTTGETFNGFTPTASTGRSATSTNQAVAGITEPPPVGGVVPGSPGISPTPSAGGLLHAYVLRPTVGGYDVVFDSGELTVPTLTKPGVSEKVSFPTGGVPVQAGDVIAFYGQGVPNDLSTGTDFVGYTAPAAPTEGSTITLGSADYPDLGEHRTYSFSASVTPHAGVATLSATGHASGPSHHVTGYQTVVNTGSTPDDADWSATTSIGPGAIVPISAPVAAQPGRTIWLRVQQDDNGWSAPASTVTPAH